MPRVTPLRPAVLLSLTALSLLTVGQADDRVRFVGNASKAYQARKMVDGKPRRETYVFAVGERFDGVTADRSFDRTTFRQIAEALAPALVDQNFWPTKELTDADLLLVVHWGVTIPQAPMQDLTGRTTMSYVEPPRSTGIFVDSPATDVAGAIGGFNYNASDERWDQYSQIVDKNARELNDRGTANLLGYVRTLAKYSVSPSLGAEQYTLLADLRGERYFVIVRAFDLKAKTRYDRSIPVWTLHLNISSPGNNFPGAVTLMSEAAAPHFGHATGDVGTSRPKVKEGRIELGDMIILGEVKTLKGAGSSTATR